MPKSFSLKTPTVCIKHTLLAKHLQAFFPSDAPSGNRRECFGVAAVRAASGGLIARYLSVSIWIHAARRFVGATLKENLI